MAGMHAPASSLENCSGTCAGVEGASKTGRPGLPPLTKALAHQSALEGVVFVTYVDAAALDFAMNWVEHLEEWGVMNFLVGDSCLFYPMQCIFKSASCDACTSLWTVGHALDWAMHSLGL